MKARLCLLIEDGDGYCEFERIESIPFLPLKGMSLDVEEDSFEVEFVSYLIEKEELWVYVEMERGSSLPAVEQAKLLLGTGWRICESTFPCIPETGRRRTPPHARRTSLRSKRST